MTMYFSEKKKFVVNLALAAGLIAIQVPLWHGVGVFAQKLRDNYVTDQQLTIVKHRNDLARQELTAQKTYLTQLDTIVPSQSQMARIVERVELIAEESDVRIKINSIVENVADTKELNSLLKKSRISLSARGSAAQLLNYLGQLEHLDQLTMVQNVSLMRIGEVVPMTPEVTQYSLQADIIFYLQNQTDAAK